MFFSLMYACMQYITRAHFCSLEDSGMGLPKPNEASTSKETMDTTSSGVKRKRGITSMHRIVKNKNTGKKLVVEYTPKGKPYGKVASELASYIGVLARTTVPISVESWPKVEKDLKNKIWESVEVHSWLKLMFFESFLW